MDLTPFSALFLIFALVTAVLSATLAGVLATILSRLSGMSIPAALLRGGASFGAALSITLAILAFVKSTLG